jgi:hypothetical protein
MKQAKPKNILFLVMLAIIIAALGLIPALASPPLQDGANIPTPTPYPVENISYELTVVGGEVVTLTSPGIEADGLTVGETSLTSMYPRGIEFTVAAESDNGEIQDVILFIQLVNGSSTRFNAEYDASRAVWVAHPWQAGEGQPGWTPFNYFWRVRDNTDVSVETEPVHGEYSDPNREWFRVESDNIIMYWFGFYEDDPDFVATGITEAMAGTEPRRMAGFGGPLGYKPVGVAYPDEASLGEIYGSGLTNRNVAGFTNNNYGMTVQQIGMPADEWFEQLKDCVNLTPREARTLEWRVNGLVYGTIPHEVTHLYQFEYNVGGPNWWTEGQAEYFTYSPGQYDARLRYLATLEDLDNLDGNLAVATNEADGCYALAYDVGPSFINWLLTTYGGIEFHAELTDLMGTNVPLTEALEITTGVSFLELQNQWRAYIGFNQLSLADVDPASALEEPIDAAFEVGDTTTLPATPFNVPLNSNPGPTSLANASCFANTQVTILRVGSLDGVNYYEIDCNGLTGWVTGIQLSAP